MPLYISEKQLPNNHKGLLTKHKKYKGKAKNLSGIRFYPPLIDKIVLRWEYPDEYHHGLMKDAVSQMLSGNSPFTQGISIKTYKLCVSTKISGEPVLINSKPEGIRLELNPAKLNIVGVKKLAQLILQHLFLGTVS
jgi:hypothetical protein